MTELELQGQYVMDFFCHREDGLGFREVKNNAIPGDLLEFPFYIVEPCEQFFFYHFCTY